jgi:thiazole synthase ThiGH ThiG subunit
MQEYTYKQFREITIRLLISNRHRVDEEIAYATANAVWNTSRDIRDAIKIARMAKSIEDVNWLVTNFLEQKYHTSTYQPKISADLAAASSSASLGSFIP